MYICVCGILYKSVNVLMNNVHKHLRLRHFFGGYRGQTFLKHVRKKRV